MPSINDYLADDEYRPPNPKPSLQQYDNYQIYSLFCVDGIVEVTETRTEAIDAGGGTTITSTNENATFQSFLAVQKYKPGKPIPVDFDAYTIAYP